ncbi:carbohydrate-binding module family 1 protein [Ceratobasidium sp. AG-Ba]|nr:carbohydrate-binding module family 1 protein [Ceratobasidium sp. AG-Ba]
MVLNQHASDVMSILQEAGCQDVTENLEIGSVTHFPIAKGGFGEVYGGRLMDGTKVAIKCVIEVVASDSDLMERKSIKRAGRELFVWSQCNHKNVLPLLGMAWFRGCISMVSPWQTNGRLDHYASRCSFSQRVQLCEQLVDGLAYIHSRGIVHSDIKPANSLVSNEGVPMFTDFGNSAMNEARLAFTQTASQPFTAPWTAPEVLLASSGYSREADIYAMAMVILAGTVVWDGSFAPYTTADDFAKWTWANQVGSYQYYIHGNGPPSDYLALSSDYKNPAITREPRGLKMSISPTATWNSNMERIELIPQTSANLGTGTLFYHFSVKRSNTNAPNSGLEHQVMFFESHFTELKYGINGDTDLHWCVGGVSKWQTPFTADTWFNFAYEINFSSGNVGLWASTGGSPLTKVVQNIAASTSTNSADFHVGVLRIVNQSGIEDWYVSGVYIEQGPITTAIGSGTGSGSTTTTTTSAATITSTTRIIDSSPWSTITTKTTSAPPTTTTNAGPTASHYAQCGGTGYSGPTTCESPYTCKAISPPYYYQCL